MCGIFKGDKMKFYFPENYGALGDGKNDDSRALQSAIDEAEKNGGGTVVLESGKTYYSSSVIMKKNVELHLQKRLGFKGNLRHKRILSSLRFYKR